ncbi:unnamed protein product [Rotaria socialis]|uniref:Uncharacterized protein n=1 Tax=Rotaria socialis TaxID=392032 RepID=A0A820TIS5_9BILA|nr:unnamed protein product [Rotaria socialis]CAF4475607.1 unnamed protein product [Rotaria socialis]
MHWIWLITAFIIISICQTRPDLSKSSEIEYIDKDGIFPMESDTMNLETSASKNNVDGSTYETTSDAVSRESLVKFKKDERDVLSYGMVTSSTNNHGHFNFLLIITALMLIIQF